MATSAGGHVAVDGAELSHAPNAADATGTTGPGNQLVTPTTNGGLGENVDMRGAEYVNPRK